MVRLWRKSDGGLVEVEKWKEWSRKRDRVMVYCRRERWDVEEEKCCDGG